MPQPRRLWTREELILSLNLYLKLPFGKLHSGTKEIIELAAIIDRTASSVAMRLNNFASVDPYHQQRGVVGLAGGKNQVEPIWKEFIQHKDDLLFESEKILAAKQHLSIQEKFPEELVGTENLKGEDKFREVKTRVNQHVFRKIVMANYNNQCAISNINIPELLVASHIIPWSKNEAERLNPENGICLSPLHDRTFDKGYIGINQKFEILLSKDLKSKSKERYYATHFQGLEGAKLNLPQKYLPRKEFLEFHMDVIFKK